MRATKDDKLKIVSLFSGIGAFEKALSLLGIEYVVENFSEVDIDAMLSYAAIHIKDFDNIEFKYESEENMRNWLIKRNIGFNFATGTSIIPKIKKDKLSMVYKACVLGRNMGDVSLINYTQKNIDLIVGGSPCQDFSVAGNMRGSIWVCKECGHEYNPLEQHHDKRDVCPKCQKTNLDKTRSSLLVEYLRAIREIRPKYFVYENVKNIKGQRFIPMFNLFQKELEEYGYKVYDKILNSKDFGIPQNRERVFVVGIREDIKKEFSFSEGETSDKTLKDFLEEFVDQKFYMSEEEKYRIFNTKIKQININSEDLITADFRYDEGIRIRKNNLIPCITTKTGGKSLSSNPYIINKNTIRKITPKECWRLMGFEDKDFYRVKSLGVSNIQLYKQAGNSITTNVLCSIFKKLLV